MSTRKLVAALALVILGFLGAHAQQPETHIYSNVEYNEDGGDLLGFELVLTANGSHANGQLKIYEGGCASPTPVSGSISGAKIQLTGASEAYGKIEVVGTVRKGALDASVRLEKGEGENVHLKEISKPHC